MTSVFGVTSMSFDKLLTLYLSEGMMIFTALLLVAAIIFFIKGKGRKALRTGCIVVGIYCILYLGAILALSFLFSSAPPHEPIPAEPSGIPIQDSAEEDVSLIEQDPTPADLTKGSVEVFEYNELALEVSNVKEMSKGSSFDGMETWEYVVYIVYPGSTMKVLNPDMFIDEESGLDHSSWAIYTADDKRINIGKNMEPLEITKDILGVFSTESSVYVLGFEVYEEP